MLKFQTPRPVAPRVQSQPSFGLPSPPASPPPVAPAAQPVSPTAASRFLAAVASPRRRAVQPEVATPPAPPPAVSPAGSSPPTARAAAPPAQRPLTVIEAITNDLLTIPAPARTVSARGPLSRRNAAAADAAAGAAGGGGAPKGGSSGAGSPKGGTGAGTSHAAAAGGGVAAGGAAGGGAAGGGAPRSVSMPGSFAAGAGGVPASFFGRLRRFAGRRSSRARNSPVERRPREGESLEESVDRVLQALGEAAKSSGGAAAGGAAAAGGGAAGGGACDVPGVTVSDSNLLASAGGAARLPPPQQQRSAGPGWLSVPPPAARARSLRPAAPRPAQPLPPPPGKGILRPYTSVKQQAARFGFGGPGRKPEVGWHVPKAAVAPLARKGVQFGDGRFMDVNVLHYEQVELQKCAWFNPPSHHATISFFGRTKAPERRLEEVIDDVLADETDVGPAAQGASVTAGGTVVASTDGAAGSACGGIGPLGAAKSAGGDVRCSDDSASATSTTKDAAAAAAAGSAAAAAEMASVEFEETVRVELPPTQAAAEALDEADLSVEDLKAAFDAVHALKRGGGTAPEFVQQSGVAVAGATAAAGRSATGVGAGRRISSPGINSGGVSVIAAAAPRSKAPGTGPFRASSRGAARGAAPSRGSASSLGLAAMAHKVL